MSNNIQRIELLDALCDRDLADMDLDGLIAKITARMNDKVGAALAGVLCEAVRIAGPEIFRAGYYQGARVGMDIAADIFKETR